MIKISEKFSELRLETHFNIYRFDGMANSSM